jgi:hypothetical protein
MTIVYYLPLFTFCLSLVFALDLWLHIKRKPRATYLKWWMAGMLTYGAGTLCESLNTLLGWNEFNFRFWYITGAFLGGAPLAQGTIYLLMKRRIANALALAFVTVVLIASVCVFLSPIDYALVEPMRMSGKVFVWQWVRIFSPFLNLYAVLFLVGGAVYSAVQYYRKHGASASRFIGNVLIAVGAILPGIGGTSTRFGHVEVLYITELIGLILIFAAYRTMRADRTTAPVHMTFS